MLFVDQSICRCNSKTNLLINSRVAVASAAAEAEEASAAAEVEEVAADSTNHSVVSRKATTRKSSSTNKPAKFKRIRSEV